MSANFIINTKFLARNLKLPSGLLPHPGAMAEVHLLRLSKLSTSATVFTLLL